MRSWFAAFIVGKSLALALVLLFQVSPQIPRKTISNPGDSANEINNGKASNAVSPPTAIENPISSITIQDKSNSPALEEKPRHIVVDSLPDKDLWDKAYFCLTAALVIIGCFTLWAIWYQAKQTKIAAEATRDAARAAAKTVEIAINKDRARIRVESANLDFEHRQIKFTVIAYGATEGFIVESFMNRSITGLREDGKALDLGVSASLPDVLRPHTPVQRWIPLELEEIGQAVEGPTAFVHLRVFVRYEDVFDKTTYWEVDARYTWRVKILDGGAMAWEECNHSSQEKESKRN